MFAVREVVLSFSGVGIANHRSADRLAGAIASASWNDRAHSLKLTLAALTLGVYAEAKCAMSAPPPLTQRHVLCVSALFFNIGAASSSRSVPSP
ncbi:unnamed protein product [Heligmosomoides polygyrus]|uniref:Anaphase-promoting complex subunit 1 n=1 Tax=Heligmosomoides polygyrus TaxID=6339 RepID=A0A183G013_HELPZ|nr:unnamed protein product [Heligmosomoides polygyrus]